MALNDILSEQEAEEHKKYQKLREKYRIVHPIITTYEAYRY